MAELDDEVIEAIDALAAAVDRNARDERLLTERLDDLRRAHSEGVPVTLALSAEREPGTLVVLGRVLARLMDSSGGLRRALARAMRSEGTSIPAIAQVFGVTHQRVSNVLARAPERPVAPPAVREPSGDRRPGHEG